MSVGASCANACYPFAHEAQDFSLRCLTRPADTFRLPILRPLRTCCIQLSRSRLCCSCLQHTRSSPRLPAQASAVERVTVSASRHALSVASVAKLSAFIDVAFCRML